MKTKSLVLLVATSLLLIPDAYAMGSGDKYQDAQVGLNYTVYKPSELAGFKTTSFKLIDCGMGREQWIAVKLGSGKKFIEIYESMSGKPCSDPGLSKKLPSVKINSITAQTHVYCDASNAAAFKKCTTADITKVGGYLMFTAKALPNLKPTQIQVQGVGGVTYKQLVAVAKGLKTLTKATSSSDGAGVPGSTQALPPVMIDPATTSEVSVRITNTIVLTVADPGNWTAIIADSKIAKFVAGGDQGSYTTHPGITPLAVGQTNATITNPNGQKFTLVVTVTP
ncbi:MAG: hypothetical protein NTV90_03580 [Actinobacteria bacterium]|nr:hypothetical protein [Actinomycetota bacterium]